MLSDTWTPEYLSKTMMPHQKIAWRLWSANEWVFIKGFIVINIIVTIIIIIFFIIIIIIIIYKWVKYVEKESGMV